MSAETTRTDKGIGLAILFGALAVASAGVQYVGAGTVTSGYGFAGAMIFATLLVVALHVYE